jgi:rfaE bifunctional protein nucleotidyltransferase chain/domain
MVTVFTSGVFDLLHAGHVHFLERCRALGDRLVIGVNCDEYARAVKGQGRPFRPLFERMTMLRALQCVGRNGRVIPFFEMTPCELIKRVRPDIVAKGSEYQFGNAPEKALIERCGGRFVIIESLPIHTSDIVTRLLAVADAEADADARCNCGFPVLINNLSNCGHDPNCPRYTD